MTRRRANGWVLDASGQPAPAAPAAITEKVFQTRVDLLAGFYGWTSYHTHDSRRSAKGFPDWAIYRFPTDPSALTGCEVLFAELKVGKRKLTPEQAGWLTAFNWAGIEAHEWRYPDDVPFLLERLARGRVRIDPTWAIEEGLTNPLTKEAA